ncbi:hypothetical protein ER308_03675 [Egibacter rhizosphaerae]|uniref:Septum formation-related domain-containing protein n=1 Tax=Egibacter rhizosphaerae TaxID=1670831 RepID=A0A411YC61_9ACTN|nr:septum formation family protein [Egibacter rhizosphaerae]QBI18737.1 hypothetical protein ER308_03675 [Egibacter rhizosphaerae]
MLRGSASSLRRPRVRGLRASRFEVVDVDDLERFDDEYPGRDEVARAAFDRCAAAFEAYVGASPARSALDVWFDHPDERAWADGDRRLVCAASAEEGEALGGSVADEGP